MYRPSLKRAFFASLTMLPISAAHAEMSTAHAATSTDDDEALFSQPTVGDDDFFGQSIVGDEDVFGQRSVSDEALFSQPTVSDEELGDQRGGFAFGGMEIKLGADIRTFLDNELALHTVITMDENGYNRVQTIGAGLTLADADDLVNSALSNGAIRMNVGDNQVYLANQGQTAIIHGNEGALQNILINTASNITASQDVTATLDLSGYDNFAATVTADQLGRSLGDDVMRAISGGLGG